MYRIGDNIEKLETEARILVNRAIDLAAEIRKAESLFALETYTHQHILEEMTNKCDSIIADANALIGMCMGDKPWTNLETNMK